MKWIGAVVLGALLPGMLPAQESADSAPEAVSTLVLPEEGNQVAEEVVVYGRNPARLRLQILRAEEAIYERFNAINSSDEFDIFCDREILTGSNIKRRVCKPVFWANAQSDIGEETARMMQGGFSIPIAAFIGEGGIRQRELRNEMEDLIGQDGELLRAMVRYLSLREIATGEGDSTEFTSAAAYRAIVAEGTELPYGAATIVDVKMRGERWAYNLTQPTFTIANLFGELGEIELECDRRRRALTYEAGVEWTAPDSQNPCVLRIDAPAGTTFSLYEFE